MTVCGFTESGFLKAKARDGILYELHPDGTSLDITKNIASKKVT